MTNPNPDVAAVAERLTEARKRCLLALPKSEGVWMTCAEMRPAGATGAGLDMLYIYQRGGKPWDRGKLCDRRFAKWGGEPGQKRGEGYEYAITPLGLAVRSYLLSQEAGEGSGG